MSSLPDIGAHVLIPGAALVGIAFAIWLWIRVSKISVANNASDENREYLLEEQRGDAEVRAASLSAPPLLPRACQSLRNCVIYGLCCCRSCAVEQLGGGASRRRRFSVLRNPAITIAARSLTCWR